ncbi:MAG: response regulator [Phycisphaerales bacterium]|nr:response regulator [Phycisphaerales bacterium]
MSDTDPAILDVCVVEDESRLRELLVREVVAMGHRGTGFESAESAWEHIAAGVDAVILDLNLPGMTGMELLEKIRNASLDTAVVILTGFGGFESAVQSLRWKVEDYLTKPCSLADIDRVLAGILSRKRESGRQSAAAVAKEVEPAASPPPSQTPGSERRAQTVEEIERIHILKVLAAHNDDKRTAADELGISLRTLYNKLNAYRQQGYLR